MLDRKEDALDALTVCLSIEPEYDHSIFENTDFDNIRNTERFKRLSEKH